MKPIFSYDKKNVFDVSQTGRLFMFQKERRCGSLMHKKWFSHSYLGNILNIKQKKIIFFDILFMLDILIQLSDHIVEMVIFPFTF